MRKEVRLIDLMGEKFVLLDLVGEPVIMYHDITDAYDKPSAAKYAIWLSWKNMWLEESELFYDKIGIASRSTCMFTITGTLTKDGVKYGFYITKTRREAFIL